MGFASDIVSVSISRQTTTVDRAGFGVPLILSYHTNFAGRTKEYSASTALTSMIADGFATTDPAYLMMNSIVSQNPRPPIIKVGRLANAATHVVECTPVLPATATTVQYTVTINGTDFTYTSVSPHNLNTIMSNL